MNQKAAMTQPHRAVRGESQEWLTPQWLIEAVGPFDLDPCSPVDRPWPTAARHYTKDDDGLAQPWAGTVWLNPPYSALDCRAWLTRLVEHGDGIALVFSRTETRWFRDLIWSAADAVLFLEGRLFFHLPCGTKGKHSAGHGSVLAAYGAKAVDRLLGCGLRGRLIVLKEARDGR